jgi:hypothetical protein
MPPEGWAALCMFFPMPPSKQFNSLPAIDAHEHQLFDKLLWGFHDFCPL